MATRNDSGERDHLVAGRVIFSDNAADTALRPAWDALALWAGRSAAINSACSCRRRYSRLLARSAIPAMMNPSTSAPHQTAATMLGLNKLRAIAAPMPMTASMKAVPHRRAKAGASPGKAATASTTVATNQST